MIIEQVGTGGTSMGKFTRASDVAYTTDRENGRFVELWSIRTHEMLAEIDTAYSHVWDGYDGSSIGRYTGGLMSGITLALGRPGYGHTHYREKR